MSSSETASHDPRELVVTACRVLHAEGQSDMVWGHVSVRDPDGRGVWLKGSQLGFDEVTVDDVLLLGWDGATLAGAAGRHAEYPIHTEIMRARDDIGGVVHTHPLHAIAFAATGRPFQHLSHEGAHFVPPDIPRFTVTSDLVETPDLGRALAESLGSSLAILMPHHGITTAAATLGEAVAAAVQLERACQIGLLAGAEAVPASPEDAVRKRRLSADRLTHTWAYLSRSVGRH